MRGLVIVCWIGMEAWRRGNAVLVNALLAKNGSTDIEVVKWRRTPQRLHKHKEGQNVLCDVNGSNGDCESVCIRGTGGLFFIAWLDHSECSKSNLNCCLDAT